jgi:hypothetical protein
VSGKADAVQEPLRGSQAASRYAKRSRIPPCSARSWQAPAGLCGASCLSRRWARL